MNTITKEQVENNSTEIGVEIDTIIDTTIDTTIDTAIDTINHLAELEEIITYLTYEPRSTSTKTDAQRKNEIISELKEAGVPELTIQNCIRRGQTTGNAMHEADRIEKESLRFNDEE